MKQYKVTYSLGGFHNTTYIAAWSEKHAKDQVVEHHGNVEIISVELV